MEPLRNIELEVASFLSDEGFRRDIKITFIVTGVRKDVKITFIVTRVRIDVKITSL